MSVLKEVLDKKVKLIRAAIVDDDERRRLLFKWFNLIFSVVAGFMSVVNIFTGKWLLLSSTVGFTLACLFNIWLSRRGPGCRRAARVLFLTETLILCEFFCISGTPEGFSALWICFIPSSSFFLLGMKWGSIYSGFGFLLIVLDFWTPFGRAALQYDYTASFMLRFPMIYLAFFLLSMFLEFVRAETHSQIVEAERRYQHLYNHDALTGVLNRYGFNEKLDELFHLPGVKTVTLMILDLDLFKRINDAYGHSTGDAVLCAAAKAISRLAGEGAQVSRWGGEEFTVLLHDEPDPEKRAETIRRNIEEMVIQADDWRVNITVTIGVCTVTDKSKADIGMLLHTADQCLYQGKDAGRNRVKAVRL